MRTILANMSRALILYVLVAAGSLGGGSIVARKYYKNRELSKGDENA